MEYCRIRQFTKYTINEKVPPTTFNRRKRELAREGDLLTYKRKRKRKTIDPNTVVPPNTVDTANEGVSEPVPPTESAQVALGAQAESTQADLNVFKSLKAGGAMNLLSLKKLKEYYAYKFEKVPSDGIAAAAKKKGLTARSVARAYMLYVIGLFLFPTKKGTNVSARYLDLFANDKILEYKNLEKKNTSLESELRQKSCLEDCNQSLSVELNKKYKESKLLKAVNALLMEQIDLYLPPATPPVPDATLTKKYNDLLSAHEDVKKKLIAKGDFEVWRQALKKALASEGIRDMGDPTFEKLFEQNERFFIITQQGPKGDYQEDLVSTAVTLKNVVIARSEKMAKKKKIQELLFQPWTKYRVDVHGVQISGNNSGFRVTVAIQHQSQHRFSNACSYGHQHVEYRHIAHLLSTYYEKILVFISHTEAYTFLPHFWARKRNTTSNEERLQNLLMDTISTLFYGHANLEIPLAFVKEQLT
ncbi:hypothetical protein GIB67_040584, partial [Kingdonia uniflora]